MVLDFGNPGFIQQSEKGEKIKNEDIDVTSNGTYTAGEGYTGLGTVNVNVADIPAVVEELNVTPTTSAQTIRPATGKDGFSPVNVAAVTSSIDSNIQQGNIKSGVSILGTTGNYEGELQDITNDIIAGNEVDTSNLEDAEEDIAAIIPYNETESLTVTPTTSQQVITAPDDVGGYTPVTVNAVTSAIDENISAGNIKSGVSILGVTGNVVELNATTLSATPTTSQQSFTPTSPNNAYSSVTVNAVTSAIDSNITAGNIKKDVTILGVTGSYEGSGGGGGGITREVSSGGVYKVPVTPCTFSLPNNAIDIASYTMYYAFYYSTGLTSIDLSSLTSITGAESLHSMCDNCTNLTEVDLSGLTTISGQSAMVRAFAACTNLTDLDLSNLTTVNGSSCLNGAFQGCTSLSSVDLSSLTTIGGYMGMSNAFSGCTGLTSVDLSSLTSIGLSSGTNSMSGAFNGCTGLTSIDLSSLETVTKSNAMSTTFSGCTNLASVDLSGLITIGSDTSEQNKAQFAECFKNCDNLTSITFTNLEKIYCNGSNTASNGTFYNNNKIQKMYFPKLDTITYGSGASSSDRLACYQIFSNCSSLTELHFGAANQTAIEATSGYSTAWGRGAGNVTIYFDL